MWICEVTLCFTFLPSKYPHILPFEDFFSQAFSWAVQVPIAPFTRQLVFSASVLLGIKSFSYYLTSRCRWLQCWFFLKLSLLLISHRLFKKHFCFRLQVSSGTKEVREREIPKAEQTQLWNPLIKAKPFPIHKETQVLRDPVTFLELNCNQWGGGTVLV